MHKNNKHDKKYNFEELILNVPELKQFVFENDYATKTIHYANPEAVKLLNKALLKTYYSIDYWEYPDGHLCPPIPGRVDYIHHLADLLKVSKIKNKHVMDIGTGATCIYPLLGYSEYNWSFVATDVDVKSIENAQTIIKNNNLTNSIELRLQVNKMKILKGIIKPSDSFAACLCNPPFYKSEKEAFESTTQKLKGLENKSINPLRNFSGTSNELWYPGGEKAFLHNYLYESSLFKTNCFWFTSLVSNKDLVKSIKKSLRKLGATQVKIINMQIGNKISRVVAWTFLTSEEQKDWAI